MHKYSVKIDFSLGTLCSNAKLSKIIILTPSVRKPIDRNLCAHV